MWSLVTARDWSCSLQVNLRADPDVSAIWHVAHRMWQNAVRNFSIAFPWVYSLVRHTLHFTPRCFLTLPHRVTITAKRTTQEIELIHKGPPGAAVALEAVRFASSENGGHG